MSRPRDQEHDTVMRRLARDTITATVSLTRTSDGKRFTRVGIGVAHPQRVLDCYAQLPPGEYVVDAVSTPGTIYRDLDGRHGDILNERGNRRTVSPMNHYERKRVTIA